MAVRLANDARDREAAMLEVAAYSCLADLQGVQVPRLVAYGDTNTRVGTTLFVATEFVKVFATLPLMSCSAIGTVECVVTCIR